jgi:IS605 OrfB family transposase
MKLVATVKLLATEEQKSSLLATLTQVNAACDWLAARAFEHRSADKIMLQRLYYRQLREDFDLSAQHAVRTISKVCEVYKRDKTKLPRFDKLGAIAYDQRLYSFKNGIDRVSLLTQAGRVVIPCGVGQYHKARLEGVRGQADLVLRDGNFYLYVTVEVPSDPEVTPIGWLGVDLGIRNLAVDSDGQFHSGERTLAVRSRIGTLRSKLQSAGTKSAKRHLKKLGKKEQRFHSNTNHVISKKIVRKAKDTARGIALEDLTHIRERVTVRKTQRAHLHGWSFAQLRAFTTYKAALAGVPCVAVDPRYTSQTCPECGCVSKANRKNQSEFVCTKCGFAEHADLVGARNIAFRAEVMRPIVIDIGSEPCENDTSPSPLQAAAL